MTNFVLVHGAMHGAWCWDRLVPLLESDARVGEVIAVDLPGRGVQRDPRPLADITLEDYVEHITHVLTSRDLSDVVLVGHSLAGLTLPPAAHRVEPRLRRVVYLAAAIPAKGQSVNDLMKHPLSPVSRGIGVDTMFCNDLDAETSEWLLSHLCEEPPRLLETIVEIPEAPASIPSSYILLERDESLPPEIQREQARNAAAHEIVSFDSGHSAFAARPRELAALLLGFA